MTTATIWASLTIPGTHFWQDASEGREYLASEHRHLFHVRAEVQVTHDDRDIEFHDLRELMEGIIREDIAVGEEGGMLIFQGRSCEALGRLLFERLSLTDIPVVSVEWSEDGEFGAIIRAEA